MINIYSIFLIAIALALDAFGVALSIGLNPYIKRENKVWICVSFGFFQFLLSYIGAYVGYLFNTYILSVPELIGGIIIIIVGMFMLKSGREGALDKEHNLMKSKKMYFILGISVSVDAAVIGFTVLNAINNYLILIESTVFIGIITLIMCEIAFVIAKYLRKIHIVSKYADYVGGIILILFGFKMIFI